VEEKKALPHAADFQSGAAILGGDSITDITGHLLMLVM
jgi:hypothetical protein